LFFWRWERLIGGFFVTVSKSIRDTSIYIPIVGPTATCPIIISSTTTYPTTTCSTAIFSTAICSTAICSTATCLTATYSTVTSEIGFRLKSARKLFQLLAKALLCKANLMRLRVCIQVTPF
jgi:hypothetical protein